MAPPGMARLLCTGWLTAMAAAQLPPAFAPPQNPTTPAKVRLGKALFWDEQLSSDDSVACGTCHMPEAGGADPRSAGSVHPGSDGLLGTDDDIHGSPGVARQASSGDYLFDPRFGCAEQVTRRTAASSLGSAYHGTLFWDGRAADSFTDPETGQLVIPYGGALERQALAPILNEVEMAQEGRTWADVRQKLQRVRPLALAEHVPADLAGAVHDGGYPPLFAAAFGSPTITARRIAFALAAYQRTLVPDQTPFDRFVAGDLAALTPEQVQGLNLFQGAARCSICHPAPFFSDSQFHNLGLRPAAEDRGRGAVTGVAADDGAFRTPMLRNAGLRPRLFHNGQSPALGVADQLTDARSIANTYLQGGGVDRSNLDASLVPLSPGLGIADLLLVLDFVQHGLTDGRAARGLPPFDHPRLHSALPPAPVRFGVSLPGVSEPGFAATAPPWLGNADWKLGLHGGDGDAEAGMFLSFRPRTPPALLAGIPVHIDEPSYPVLLQLHGSPGAPGVATWRQPLPSDPSLAGLIVYLQLFVVDAAAPTGIAASQALALVLR